MSEANSVVMPICFSFFTLQQVYFTFKKFLKAPREETGTKCCQVLEIMGLNTSFCRQWFKIQ